MRFTAAAAAAAADVSPGVRAAMAVAAVVLSVAFDSAAAAKNSTPYSVWYRPEPNPPRRKDMKIEKLNRLIGSDYNEMWMSKTAKITANGNGTGAYSGKSRTTRPDHLQLPDQLPAQYQEMMRAWLVHRSSCPVEYVWTDLGKSFWPRWIRVGRCGRSDIMSCSWPPGMACVPSSVKVLGLLRWHCWLKNRKNKRRKNQERKPTAAVDGGRARRATGGGRTGARTTKKKKKEEEEKEEDKTEGTEVVDNKFRCLWIKVPYPVTEDCTCSCRKPNE